MDGVGKSLCLVPARGGSKRLERKNVLPFQGKPLIAHTITAALDADVFDRVCVSTEDEEIAAVSEEYGAEVPFERPAELATDTAQVVDVCEHALDYFEEQGSDVDVLAVLLPTTPLRGADDLRGAGETFKDADDAEFLMCTTDYVFSPFEALEERDGSLHRFWEEASFYADQSQDRPDLVVDNGAAYIVDVDAFRRERTFYGSTLTGYHMPLQRSIDVDTHADFELAECLYELEHHGGEQ